MRTCTRVLVCAALGLASWQASGSCYTVYDEANRVLYQSALPPVDMSLPIHQTLPSRFRGALLVFDTERACEELPIAARSRRPVSPASPVLTNVSAASETEVPPAMPGANREGPPRGKRHVQ